MINFNKIEVRRSIDYWRYLRLMMISNQSKRTDFEQKKLMRENNKMGEDEERLTNDMDTIICSHCDKEITSPALAGLTLVCPYCKKSVNGQYYHQFDPDSTKE